MKTLFNFRSGITLILILSLKIAEEYGMLVSFFTYNAFEDTVIRLSDIIIYILIIINIIYTVMEGMKWFFKRNKEVPFEEMNKKYSYKD